MATKGTTNIQKRGEKFQLRITHPELPKPRFFTFDEEQKAINYREMVEAWFALGQVPKELHTEDQLRRTPLIRDAIRDYERGTDPAPAPSEAELIPQLIKETENKRVADVTYQWAIEWIKALKVRKLAPGTIRKRVGLLARVLDHHFRSTHKPTQTMPANVLRMLPKNYSVYADAEVVDQWRDVRLSPEQDAKIVSVLEGWKRPDRERVWGHNTEGGRDPAFKMLFRLVTDTGMRLKEAYTARVGDIDVEGRFIRVRGSKGHRGKIKWRTAPLKPALYTELVDWCADKGPDELILPFWTGTAEDLKRCQMRLSNRFTTLFAYAQVGSFTEHDLRHEACCRWVMLRDSTGRWMFTDGEICKIMGWTDPKLLLRYMSLRGEDLSLRLH